MKKLTLVLVALLLALTCVFVACGKKNETPVDNTDPKPVDNTPAPVETPTVEDMTPVAEQFKKDLAANYVDLYSKEVETAIDAEKAAALLKIMGASTKEEAQKIADEFIAFLKAQKTTVDVLKDLIAQIGDVALADEDLIKEVAAYKKALDAAYAGTNEAKKAVLDAYKADKETQDTIEDMSARLAALKEAKAIAAAKKDDTIKTADKDTAGPIYTAVKALFDKTTVDGKFDTDSVNLQIAALNEEFTKEDKTFNLADVNYYEEVVANAKALADIYKIEVGSDAYNEVFDVATLAAAKTVLDTAINADPVLVAMKDVVAAYEALSTAAEAARYKEYCFIDKDVPGVEYDTKEAALEADVKEENIKEVERNATKTTKDYKLSLAKDLEAALKVSAVLDKYAASKLQAYGYHRNQANTANDDDEVVYAAKKGIDDIKTAYIASVGRAAKLFDKDIYTVQYTDIDLTKKDTVGYFDGFETAPKSYKVATTAPGTKLGDEIKKVVGTFKTVNAAGYSVSTTGYLNEGDYTLKAKDNTDYKFYLKDGKAAIAYTAFTYAWQIEKAGDLTATEFDVLKALADTTAYLDTSKKSEDGNFFMLWLAKYIDDGEYAESYDLDEYKAYNGAFTKKVLYMTDRAVTEVATAKVAEINGAKVADKPTEALVAKVLSPYTIAQAMVDEAKKIADAKAAALEEVAAAALALREAGDTDAIAAADALYQGIVDGSYLDEKFNGEDAGTYTALYADATNAAALKVVVKVEKKTETTKNVSAVIGDAKAALTAAEKLVDFSAISDATLKAAKTALKTNEDYVKAYAKFIERADAAEKVAKDAYDLTKTDGERLAEGNESKYTGIQAKVANVKALYNLLLSDDAFKAANDGHAVLAAADGAAQICDNILKDFSASGDTYATIKAAVDGGTATTEQAADKDLYDYLASIYVTDTYTGKAQDELQKDVADAEEALAKAYDEFKITLKASDTVVPAYLAKINAAITNIATFATNNNADFINLTITKTYGDKVVTVDLLTETYRQKVMAIAYGAVAKAVAYAGGRTTPVDLTAGGAGSWEKKAQAGVDANTFTVAEVTSIKAAAEAIEKYEFEDDLYDLDEALRQINVANDPDITLETLKANLK